MAIESLSARARVAVLLGVLTPFSLDAQPQVLRRGQSPGPRVIVPTFRNGGGTLGYRVAEAVRDRIASDFDIRKLWVVPESTITAFLEQSGYGPTEPLPPNDVRQLASYFRADEYFLGRVTETPDGGYRVEVDWSLMRRPDMVQPLSPVEAPRISDVAKLLSREFQAARRQLESVSRCVDHAQRRNYAAALEEARKAIDAYPRSALARVCIANVYDQMSLGPDSMIRISEEILAIHPQNSRALGFAADAYAAKGMAERQIDALERLFALDSTSSRVARALTEAYVNAGDRARMRQVIDAAVRHHPNDTELLRLRWLLLLAKKEWSAAVTAGEELATADTTATDTLYFVRMAAALGEVGQPERAAEMVARGRAKFPEHGQLAVLEIQLLRRAGQLDRARAAADRLVARAPRTEHAWLQRAQIQAALSEPADSILASLRTGADNGEDRELVARYSATLGQAASRAAAGRSIEDLRAAVRYYKLAETLQPSDTTAYLLGASSGVLGQRLADDARARRSCDLAKEMRDALVDAQINLPRGGRAFPGPANEALTGLSRFLPYAEQLERALCR